MWSEGQNGCREQVGYVCESGGRSQGQLRKSFVAQKMVDAQGRGPGQVLQGEGKEEADDSELQHCVE